MTYARLPLLLLLLPLGCGSATPPPESYAYALKFEAGLIPYGAGLYRGEKRLGTVMGPAESGTSVDFRLPRGTSLSALDAPLTVRLLTPCGLTAPAPVTVSLTQADEQKHLAEATADSLLRVAGTIEPRTWPAAAVFWAEWRSDKDAPVSIGQAAIDASNDFSTRLFDMGCAPRHEITIGGKPVGTFEPEPAPPHGAQEVHYLIARDASECYREREFKYAAPGQPNPDYGGMPPRILSGSHVYALGGAPSYRFKPAPARSSSDGAARELYRLPCE